MKSSDFIIEHQCPQCGAPAELEETDRIFTCDYCRVTSCLLQHRYFRYILPHKAPDGTDIVYFPYWHFRGFHLACTRDKIVKRFVDSTCQAMTSDIFPFSLGLRSQTLKLKFATDETDGNFIKPNIQKPQVMDIFKARFLNFFDDPPAHQAFIGESLSLIYAPFYVKDVLYDAVLNKPATNSLPDDVKPENLKVACYPPKRSNWRIGFTPAICPECGWDLTGKRNAIVFLCNNCHRAWRAGGKTLQPRRVSALIVPGNKKDTTYLPFWRIRAQVSGMILNTVADFVKAANLPKVITEDMTKDKFYFWSPAFRLDPDSFVRLGNLMTINQSAEVPENTLPDANAFSVTLPVKEAVESLKTTLAGFIKPKRIFYKRLPKMRIIPRRFMLVFIPFTDKPYELTHYKYPIAINKKMLTRMKSL